MVSVLSRRAATTFQVRLFSTAARRDPAEPRLALVKEGPKLTKLPNGITVASVENHSPISRIAVVANAGARYESPENLGVTHCLRVAAGLSTQASTAFGIARNLEQIGANFTCSSSREYMFYSIECLRDSADVATGILQQVVTAPVFKPWEVEEIQDRLKLDLALMKDQPHTWCYDLLHQAAFRDTLGRSLYAPEYMVGKYSPEQLLHYMKTYYSTGRLALVGVGVNHDDMVEMAQRFTPFASAPIAADRAKYYGGEMRHDIGGNTVFAAFAVEGPSLASRDLLHAAVLQNVLGMGPTIKYSQGGVTSHLIKAIQQVTSQPFAASCINANYTDNGLFGFYVIAQPEEVEKVLRAAYGQFVYVARDGVGERHVAMAKNQLKAQIAMYLETNEALLQDLGEQALGSDQILTTMELFKFVDAINTSDVTTVAKKLVNGKPSMAAVGNLSRTPYLDQLVSTF